MHISIIGTGYVGLVTGTCFAELGNDVTCVDIDENKIKNLQEGVLPIYEPGLELLVSKNLREGRLRFTTDMKSSVEDSLILFIAVDTPSKKDGSADLRNIENVAKKMAAYFNGYKVVVNKSTAPVGSAKHIRRIIGNHLTRECNFDVVSNPEFLREGSAIEDFMRPNRVVIGAESDQAIAIMKELYSPLYLIETPFVITNPQTAELIKYASNAFLATKVSFINEIAIFCDMVGADVHHVAQGMGLDNRIGRKFLHPGPGFGGSCFPKDTRALLELGRQNKFIFEIVSSAVAVNERQIQVMIRKIKDAIGNLDKLTLGVLGLSFKPNTDDIREAPSLKIIPELVKAGATVKVFDPAAMEHAKMVLPSLDCCEDTYEVAKNSDALIFLTEWNQFRSLDLDKIKRLMKTPVIVDLRNIYDPEKMKAHGFNYTCVGRPTIKED